MRYVMKQRMFSLLDHFTIRDADGNDVYRVDGKAFALGHHLSFRNLQDQELAFIRQKSFTWGPTYEIYRNGALTAVVKKTLFTFAEYRFTIDVPGPDDLVARGDLLQHEYEFLRGEQRVAHVSKEWFTWVDTYGVDVADGEDDILVLASTAVIDVASER